MTYLTFKENLIFLKFRLFRMYLMLIGPWEIVIGA